MVERASAGLAGQRHRRGEVERAVVRIDRAAEIPVGVMVVGRALVAARHDHQGAVLGPAIVEHDADRQHVVVGVRVERPVLVPLDRRAVFRRLDVELRAIQPHAGAEQLAGYRQQRLAAHERVEHRIERVRLLDPAHARTVRAVRRLEIVDIVVGRDRARPLDEAVDHPAQRRERGRIDQFGHHDVAVLAIEVDVVLGNHLEAAPWDRPMVAPPHPRCQRLPYCWRQASSL